MRRGRRLRLSVVNVFLAPLLTNDTFNIMSTICIIILPVLITKNAILLVDHASQRLLRLLRRLGAPIVPPKFVPCCSRRKTELNQWNQELETKTSRGADNVFWPRPFAFMANMVSAAVLRDVLRPKRA